MSPDALLGLVMLIVMIGAIFIGFPISFTLLFLALAFGYVGLGDIVFSLAYFQTIGMMKEELFAAVPLFIFMGYITEQAGLMERLFIAFRNILAPVRGALFAVVILTAAVFAMATGIVGAAVTVLGIMASPIMNKTGYDPKLAAGCITAGGTLGILIPPSVMLIVMGPVIGVSVAELYSAAFGPGFLLAGIYLVYLIIRSNLNPKLGPPVPKELRVSSPVQLVTEVLIGVVPLLVLIGAVLGSMLGGLATPTEASAVGAEGAAFLTLAYRKFTWAGFRRAVLSTTATSSMVLLPIFYPVMDGLKATLAPALGIAPDMLMVWFGATVAVVLQTAYLSPPVAMSAYYLRQVVREWSLATIYKGMFEFMMLQCLAVALIVIFPKIVTTFPEQLRAEGAAVKTEEVDDSANRLEEDPLKAAQDQLEQQQEPEEESTDLEKDE